MTNTNSLALSTAALTILLAPIAADLPAQLIPPVVAKELKKEQPARAGLTGTWRGTATETIEGAGELSFPIQLRFSGPANKLALAVSGTAKVEGQQGQKLTVEIQATYAGKLTGDTLMMMSRQIRTRIVETGQTLPSSSQTLTAKLANGVLSGRVGSAGEGWTQFTARQGSQRPEPKPKAAPEWVGSWEGNGRETGPDGRPMTYPVQMRITRTAKGLHAQMLADVKYPTGNGQTVPVEYRASFQVTEQRTGLAFRSDRVQVHIPSHNRTENAPAQQGQGMFRNGQLSIRFGAGEELTQVTLRRTNQPTPNRGGTEGPNHRGEVIEDVVIDGDEPDGEEQWGGSNRQRGTNRPETQRQPQNGYQRY